MKKPNPTSIRLTDEVRTKVRRICKANGMKRSEVLRLAIATGVNLVEQKLAEMKTAVPA